MSGGFYRLFAIAALAVRIVVVGDAGAGSDAVARGIAAIGPVDAIILTGDNIYPCGVQSPADPHWSVLRPLASLGIPIYPVLGNHDYCGNPDAQIAAPLPNWKFPAREYHFETPFAQFQMIDTTPYVRGLKPAPHLFFNDARWRIVVGHHPILSSGYHGYFPRDEHRRMLELLPAMRDVDLYICGHDHDLELIDAKPLMLISGAGSEPIPAVLRRGASRFVTEGRVKGFAVLDLTATTMAIQFYDSSGKPISRPFRYRRP